MSAEPKPKQQQQETEKVTVTRAKIQEGLYHNKYILTDDLLLDPFDYDYDVEIINNISRPAKSDWWYCYNCTWKGDKWFMMKHPCKHNKKQRIRNEEVKKLLLTIFKSRSK
ncbi:MAG: hypothetical protein ACM3XP_02265 [Nitrososphaerales archaeon]|jgi:hypothetical protein